MIELVPALALLSAFIIIFVMTLRKFTGEQLAEIFTTTNFLLLAAMILFCILVVVHLFQAQTWTADVLKVIVGVLVGAGASYANDKGKKELDDDQRSGVDVGNSTFGDNVKLAGRDINETIQNIRNDIQNLKDEVTTQSTIIDHALANLATMGRDLNGLVLRAEKGDEEIFDYLFNTIHNRFYDSGENRVTRAIENVINHWRDNGWKFVSFTSDYQGIDGLVLLFSRPAKGTNSEVLYFHGSKMEDHNT